MLRLFGVNTGSFLRLDSDVLPTARVAELSVAVGGGRGEGVVLMTPSGRQLEPTEVIGSYSVGTESKPIFVFFQSYLQSPTPPLIPSRLTRTKSDTHLQLLQMKPTPSLFQRQVVLSKQLGEYASELGALCRQLATEYRLQCAGWAAVLHNCQNIIRTYQRHQQLFSLAVESFTSTQDHYLHLLQQFPERMKLLQSIPVPQDMTSSLYEWISTHDERNSLADLRTECQKALAKVDNEQIQHAMAASEQILESAESAMKQGSFREQSQQLQQLTEKAADLTDIQSSLAQNIQSTSQRALRSGDGGTVAELVVSHQRSLQLMADQNSQLESHARTLEDCKTALSKHIHSQLQMVTQLQMQISESNSHLVLLHEHIKLAKKRFEVLDQVSSTPEVLGRVMAEIERRRAFSEALTQKVEATQSQLRRAREQEKVLRLAFQDSHRQHFTLSLFPELQDRAPDFICQLTSREMTPPTPEADLTRIRELLQRETSPASATPSPLPDPMPTDIAVQTEELGPSERGFQQMKAELAAVRDDEESLRQQLLEMEGVLERERGERERLAGDVSRLERESAALAEEKGAMEARVREREAAIRQLKEEVGLLRTSQERERSAELVQSQQEKGSLEEEVRELQRQLELCQEESDRLREQHAVEVEGLRQQCQESDRLREQHAVEVEGLRQQCQESDRLREQHAVEVEGLRQQCQESDRLREQHAVEVEGLRQQCQEESDRLREQHAVEVEGLRQQCQESDRLREQHAVEVEGLRQQCQESDRLREQHAVEVEGLRQQCQESDRLREQHAVEVEGLRQQCQEESDRLREQHAVEVEGLRQQCQESDRLREQHAVEVEGLRQQCQESDRLREQHAVEVEGLKRQCQHHIEERHRQESRHQQAQAALGSLRAQLEQAQGRVLSLERAGEGLRRAVEEAERGRSLAGERLAQLEGSVDARVEELEEVVRGEREAREEAEQRLAVVQEQLFHSEEEVKRLRSLVGDLEGQVGEKLPLLTQVSELERVLSEERDMHMKQSMELEREVRELRRQVDGSPPSSPSLTTPTKPSSPLKSISGGLQVSINNLQVGDAVVFMSDPYGNFLAVVTDGKLYYLNQTSVATLTVDISNKVPQLQLKRKMLLGRITAKVYVEVRKEGNRLHVPVGTRLYKVDAEDTDS